MSSLEQRQAELQSRLASIDAEITKLDDQFTQLAASWNGTDGKAALKSAEQIEQRLNQLRREKALTIASQGHVTKQQLDEKQAAADAERTAKQAECRQLADGIVTMNAELDDALIHLREMLERRAALLHQLGTLGVNPAIVTKLGKSALTRAACHAGLWKFIDINKCAPSALCTLTSTNPILSSVAPTQDPTNGVCSNAQTPSPTNGKEFCHDDKTHVEGET